LNSPSNKHLSNDELDSLVMLAGQTSDDTERPSELSIDEARRHVESCGDCNRMLQMHKRAQAEILGLVIAGQAPRSLECVDREEWIKVAAGVLPQLETQRLMHHAAQCEHCGPLLKKAAQTLSDEVSSDEERLLASLGSSQLRWQQEMAETLWERGSDRNHRGKMFLMWQGWLSWPWQGWLSWPRQGLAAAALAILVVAVWLGLHALRAPSAEQLLAQAYTEHRTLEVRIPGADYAPMRLERSANGSSMDRSPALLKAEALISENLNKHPNDPDWLQAKGKADLLDGNYESAISVFRRALELHPDAPELQMSLASSYFVRGLTEDRAADYTFAVDLFGRVLQKQPNNKIALFNRAIVLEHLYLFTQAAEDWKTYLQLDPSGAWSKEAADRLQHLKLRQDTHDKGSVDKLMEPNQLVTLISEQTPNSWGRIDRRLEEYQSLAVQEWLGRAYPLVEEPHELPTSSAARRAVRLIAKFSISRRGDRWLDALLVTSLRPEFAPAIHDLRDAILASTNADYVTALREARASQILFRRMNNVAGLSRATFEVVFALHFSNNAPECARLAVPLITEARRYHFRWIQVQSEIEDGICKNTEGNYRSARAVLASAITNAHLWGYTNSEMRALTMQGLVAWSKGSSSEAWSNLTTGLRQCWENYCPPMTMYSLYANMDNFAEDSRQWYLQVLLIQQALSSLGDDPDHLMRAVEHNRLAKAAMLAGMPTLARQEFAAATKLLDSVPQTEVTTHYRAGIQIDLAKLASEENNPRAALTYLSNVSPAIHHISDHFLLTDYYETLGHLELRSRQNEKAQEALQWAVAFAESQLSSLDSEKERLEWRDLSGKAYRDLVELNLNKGEYLLALQIWEWYLDVPSRPVPGLHRASSVTSQSDIFAVHEHARTAPALPELSAGNELIRSLHDATLISFAMISDRVAVWVADDRGTFFTWLPGATNIALQARTFRRLCADPDSDVGLLRIVSKDLFASLLAPVSAHLSPARTLIFDGDSEFVDIPLQALMDQQGRYLADSFSLTTIPSIYYTSHLRESSFISPTDPVLLLASTKGGYDKPGGLFALPDVLEEVNEIGRKFHQVHQFTNDDMNNQSLKNEFGRAVLFHFAGHSQAKASATSLIIANSTDALDASRVRSFHPSRLQLAVLSACMTESATEKGLEDPNSLALAFLEAGVPHVVASRWDVDSATTVTFMREFYGALLSRKSVPQAVRSAAAQIRGLPRTERPYYWAAFSSFGTS
jgi:CHAT domain-containing protein/tetratricopeptide (TPR) repeat protein